MLFSAVLGFALLANKVSAITTGDDLKAIRDDIYGICIKAYGGKDNGIKNCRPVLGGQSQRHIHYNCHKSGWSGKGKLSCRYGVEMYTDFNNQQGAGDQAVHPGAIHSGRRRLQDDFMQGDSAGMGSGLGEEDRELREVPAEMASVTYELENLEDTESVEKLGRFKMHNSICLLQGMKAIGETPACDVKTDAEGSWTLKMTSAACTALCVPKSNLGL